MNVCMCVCVYVCVHACVCVHVLDCWETGSWTDSQGLDGTILFFFSTPMGVYTPRGPSDLKVKLDLNFPRPSLNLHPTTPSPTHPPKTPPTHPPIPPTPTHPPTHQLHPTPIHVARAFILYLKPFFRV